MSTLEKHPGPWKFEGGIFDANGNSLVSGGTYDLANCDAEVEEDVKPLILATPILLEALAVAVSENAPRDIMPFNLLIGWLNGEPGYLEVNLEAFLKWLREERTTIVITREGEARRPEAAIEHVRETTFGVSPNPVDALRNLLKSDPESLEALGQRLGATSPVKLDEASFDEAARELERPALRCHVCGAPTEKTYNFERTYENKAYEARTLRLAGVGLCDGCVPRTHDGEGI